MPILPAILAASILPNNVTVAERALEDAMRVGADISVIGTLWNPAECPADVLPFLAWGFAVPHWDSDWTVQQKRTACADAIAFHQIKGTRAAVEQVLTRFNEFLTIVEWWQSAPKRTPHTFEIRAPADLIPASFLTTETTEAIIRDVAGVMPARCHFDFVQSLEAAAMIYLTPAAMTATFGRSAHAAAHDPDARWGTYLLTEDGEPFETETGLLIEDIA